MFTIAFQVDFKADFDRFFGKKHLQNQVLLCIIKPENTRDCEDIIKYETA